MKKKYIICLLAFFLMENIFFFLKIKNNNKKFQQVIRNEKTSSDKHLTLYLLMVQWVKVKQENKSIIDYLKKHNITEIAIYGMNYVGETLIRELKNSEIKICYGIDQNAEIIASDYQVVLPDSELKEVDAIIVTPISYFDEIEEKLSKKINCKILSIEDILFDL